jgi:hypothetical protein
MRCLGGFSVVGLTVLLAMGCSDGDSSDTALEAQGSKKRARRTRRLAVMQSAARQETAATPEPLSSTL